MRSEKSAVYVLIILMILSGQVGLSNAAGSQKTNKINKTEKWLGLLRIDRGVEREIDKNEEHVFVSLPADLKKEFKKYSATIFDKQKIMSELFVPFFSKRVTEADLDRWISFYSSEVGKSIIAKQVDLKKRQNEIIKNTIESVKKGTAVKLPSADLNDPGYAKSLKLFKVLDYKKNYEQVLRMISRALPPFMLTRFKKVFTEHYYLNSMAMSTKKIYTNKELDAAIDFFSSTAYKNFIKKLPEIIKNQRIKYKQYIQSRIERLQKADKIPQNLASYLLRKKG
ncbi:DUF2059 domain-containing protein [Desulfobacterota bacterium M19]